MVNAVNLHAIARDFLSTFPLLKTMASLGEFYFTGSYVLDLMTWPDLDLQLKLGSQVPCPSQIVAALMETLVADRRVRKVDFRNFKDHPKPGMSQGIYLGVDISDDNLKRFQLGSYWKVDCWILEDQEFEQNQLFMQKLKVQMTPAHQDLIMQYKKDWTRTYGTPPSMASYFLYQAVVFEGLIGQSEILTYLREKGVKI